MKKMKSITCILALIVGAGITANLSGCKSPITNTLLHHCEARNEVSGAAHQAVEANGSIFVQYDGVIRPVSHGGIELTRKTRWMEISNAYHSSTTIWSYNEKSHISQTSTDADSIPIRYYGGNVYPQKDFETSKLEKAIYTSKGYPEGFTFFYRDSTHPQIIKTHCFDARDTPAPRMRYIYYALIPFTVIYDTITIPFWIKDTIFFHDT